MYFQCNLEFYPQNSIPMYVFLKIALISGNVVSVKLTYLMRLQGKIMYTRNQKTKPFCLNAKSSIYAILLQFSRWNVGQFNFNVLLNAFSMTAIAARLFNANKGMHMATMLRRIWYIFHAKTVQLHYIFIKKKFDKMLSVSNIWYSLISNTYLR